MDKNEFSLFTPDDFNQFACARSMDRVRKLAAERRVDLSSMEHALVFGVGNQGLTATVISVRGRQDIGKVSEVMPGSIKGAAEMSIMEYVASREGPYLTITPGYNKLVMRVIGQELGLGGIHHFGAPN